MKWLKRGAFVLLGLGLVALAGAAAVFWAIGTESGANWLVQRLVAAAPPLSIERVRGSLLGDLRLEAVRLRTARDELDIDVLELTWNAPALLTGVLAFERAAAANAIYRRVPSDAPGGGGPPALPWLLRIDAGSVGELSVTVAGTTLVFTATTFEGTYGDGRLTLMDVAGAFGDTTLAAEATFELSDGIDLDVAGSWSGPLAGVASSGNVELAGAWPELNVRHELEIPFAMTTTGTLALSPFRFDLDNNWQDLAWPGVTGVASPSGRLALAGALADYRYEGAGTADILGRAAAFTVEGMGQNLLLALAAFELAPAAPGGGTLRGTGSLDLERRETALDVTAASFDPAWVVAAWPGRLDGTARLRAALAPEPNAALDAIALAGELRGYDVTIGGAAAVTGRDRFSLDSLRLDSGANRVVLNGTLDSEQLEVTLDAELDELDLLVPDANGALTAAVALGGRWQELRGEGAITLREGAFAGVTLERLEVSGAAGLAADAPVALTVAVAGLARGSFDVRALDATVEGTAAAHTIRLAVVADGVAAIAAATGALAADVWSGTLARLDIDEDVFGSWRLEAPAAVGVGRNLATVANSCLVHESRARFCTQLDLTGTPEDSLVVSGQNFDLAVLRPVLPPEVELAGVYQLSGSLFDLTGDPRGALAVAGGTTVARVAFNDEQTFATELDLVQAGMTLTAGRLALTAAVRRSEGGSADVDAEIADVRVRDSRLTGTLRAEWPDVGFLALLSPELEQIEGAVAVDLDVGGTVAEPTLDGRAAFSNGRVAVPRWGLVVEGIEATATSSQGRALTIDATGRAGDGVLTLAGTTELDPEAGWPTALALRGDTVRVVQLPDVEIFASPDLRVDVALPVIDVTGRVHVPRATLALDVLPAQAVAPSPDAVVHGVVSNIRSQPVQFRTSIELTLGDDVRYSGLNLDTAVTGELRLTTEPSASASATGTLRLAGTYDAYGQTLELERGQLLFSGPLDDPGLDVRAVRMLETTSFGNGVTEAGIELTGTLKQPRTRVFSTPAMSEADALSYLLFGRPMSGSSAGMDTEETSALQTAALSLGLQQALPVVQRIGNTLGLDELTVQSTDTDAGALMAGKYLSPRVYIRYSYGLFNRIGGFLLRFRVNDRLSIETRSGEQESMDLFYTVEKE
jgi:translocation and assembly module TamB